MTVPAPAFVVRVPGASGAAVNPTDWQSFRSYRSAPMSQTVSTAERVGHAQVIQGRLWLAGGELAAPVRARVEFEDGLFFAIEPATGIFGAGPGLAVALEDLRAALREHLDVLQVEGQVSEELQRQLDFLRRHLRHPGA